MRDLKQDVEDDVDEFVQILSWTDTVSFVSSLTLLVLLAWWWLY